MSHSPLMERNVPRGSVNESVESALTESRQLVEEFDPDVVVCFGPDHYNGFNYSLMPSFCVGLEARTVGDWDTRCASLDVPYSMAEGLTSYLLDHEFDVAFSYNMLLDHGFAQPLDTLGVLERRPTIPIFVNAVARPLGPISRARKLGKAVGEYFSTLDTRVLFVGSGGLSHDPPVPSMKNASAETRRRLVEGSSVSQEERVAREAGLAESARLYAEGEGESLPLNPAWDNMFLDILDSGILESIDELDTDTMAMSAGNSSHEVRCWVAAFSALAATGEYTVKKRLYWPIEEWFAGFSIVSAVPGRNTVDRW